MSDRIAVIGAGPIGLEAALYGLELGFDVTLYEAGTVGDNVRRWGFVRLFSPWRISRSPLGEAAVRRQGSVPAPPDSYPTGREYARDYLVPLSSEIGERGRLLTSTRVLAIGRHGMLKGDAVGDREREERPFRLLLAGPAGEEFVHSADAVLDCSGTYGNANQLGSGGIPAPGERKAAQEGRLSYVLRDVTGADRAMFAGRRTMVVGSGYSAATALDELAELAGSAEETEVLWVTRTSGLPCPTVEDDPLPERDRLARQSNAFARGSSPDVSWVGGATVERLEPDEHGVVVTLGTGDGERRERVHHVLAHVGYWPDRSLYRELQVHESSTSFAPMRPVSNLGERAGDGTDAEGPGGDDAEAIGNPEPGFFVLGSKSFGRKSSFLIRIGLEQVRDAYRLLTGDPLLDLYEEARSGDETSAGA